MCSFVSDARFTSEGHYVLLEINFMDAFDKNSASFVKKAKIEKLNDEKLSYQLFNDV
jgi:hypothetical protein